MNDLLHRGTHKERSLEQFVLQADCASCNKPIRKGEGWISVGNPGVFWKFHITCWRKLPKKWRRQLDVYGGEDVRFTPENKL